MFGLCLKTIYKYPSHFLSTHFEGTKSITTYFYLFIIWNVYEHFPNMLKIIFPINLMESYLFMNTIII